MNTESYSFDARQIKFVRPIVKTIEELHDTISFMKDYIKYIREQIRKNKDNSLLIKTYKKDLRIAKRQLRTFDFELCQKKKYHYK